MSDQAEHAEADGFDGLWTTEARNDPFLPLAIAAESTSRLVLGTGIAVALARNPMSLAILGNDLQLLSRGRFLLGLGSQVAAHITRRYSMPWSQPASRMRELVLAIKAIWESWDRGSPLEFHGEFYHHTLMTPFFDPGPNPFGNPKVLLAGVGTRMTEVAGEVADGLIVHPFTTSEYLQNVSGRAFIESARRAGRPRGDLTVYLPGLVVTGSTDEQVDLARDSVRRKIAFYASTPTYRSVLELHGWGGLQPELHSLTKRGDWERMTALIDEPLLDALAVVASPAEVATRAWQRFGGVVDRFGLYLPYPVDEYTRAALLDGFLAQRARTSRSRQMEVGPPLRLRGPETGRAIPTSKRSGFNARGDADRQGLWTTSPGADRPPR